jgi:hypothetical protein
MSNVIAFPGPRNSDDMVVDTPLTEDMIVPMPKACDHCIHFLSGYLGSYCRAYEEDIFSVHEAADCEQFEQP